MAGVYKNYPSHRIRLGCTKVYHYDLCVAKFI